MNSRTVDVLLAAGLLCLYQMQNTLLSTFWISFGALMNKHNNAARTGVDYAAAVFLDENTVRIKVFTCLFIASKGRCHSLMQLWLLRL